MNGIAINLLGSLSAIKGLSELDCEFDDEKMLVKKALATLMQNQDMERCSFFILNGQGLLVNLAGIAIDEIFNPRAWPNRPLHFRIGEGIIGNAALLKRMFHCPNCRADPRFVNLGDALRTPGSIISAPVLTLNRDLIGVLNVSHPESGYFNDWHTRLLDVFVNMLGQLLTNYRLFKEMETEIAKRTAELSTLLAETTFLKDHYAGLSLKDQLTGLYNRHYLHDQIEKTIARHKRYDQPFSLLMIDIDNFKSVNDLFGHAFGDSVLIGVAKALKRQVRNTDILVRYGGEEFIVVTRGASGDKGQPLAERIRRVIRGLQWPSLDKTARITLSIGINSFSSRDLLSGSGGLGRIIHNADLALYTAKAQGKDRIAVLDNDFIANSDPGGSPLSGL